MPEDVHHSWVSDVFGVDPRNFAEKVGAGLKSAGEAVVHGAVVAEQAVVHGAQFVGHEVAAGAVAVEQAVVHGAQAIGGAVMSGVHAVEHGVHAVAKAAGDSVLAAETKKFNEAMAALDLEIKHVADAGLDSSHYGAQAKALRASFAEAAKTGTEAARVIAIGKLMLEARDAASAAKKDVARVQEAAVEGVGRAVTDMRDGAKKLIDAMPKTSDKKPELGKRLGELDAEIAAQGKVTDRAARAKKLKQINVTAEALLDDAAAGSKDKAAIEAIYAKALKDRYGIKIANPKNMPNTHLEQVYKMFDKVPETDVVQGKLKTLEYKPLDKDEHGKDIKNTGAAYGDAVITMGDYGDETWDYTNPATGKPDVDPKTGKPVEPNGFSISTLHELGHSIDDRFGIMNANQTKSGGGGWRGETLASTAQAFLAQFRAGPGRAVTVHDKDLLSAIEGALGGTASRPKQATQADWALLIPLLDNCVARGSTKWPWGSPYAIGGRAYHESYPGEWWSYDMAVRAKALTVRDYQWRAPGEWFAELYAYSYYNSKPPPGGVDGAITAYLFGGKSAAAGAPAAKH